MLSSTQTRPETQNGHGMAHATALALAFGTALTIDHLAGAHGNATRQANPEFYDQPCERAGQTLGVLPGCQSDGRLIFEDLSPLVTNANLVVTDYPKHGFNLDAICEGLGRALLAQRAERPSLLCQSMGGIVMRHFLHYAHDTGLAEQLGGFSTVVLDSSPFDANDIHLKYRFLLGAAHAGHRSWTADVLKQKSVAKQEGGWKNARLSAIHGQGKFMHSRHPRGPLPNIMDRVVYVQGSSDHVINTEVAAGKYLSVTPEGKGHVFIDHERPEHSHTAGVLHMPYLLGHIGLNRNTAQFDLVHV